MNIYTRKCPLESCQDLVRTLLEALLAAEFALFRERELAAGRKVWRNGFARKVVRGRFGEFTIRVPRDRVGLFAPVVLPKGFVLLGELEQTFFQVYGIYNGRWGRRDRPAAWSAASGGGGRLRRGVSRLGGGRFERYAKRKPAVGDGVRFRRGERLFAIRELVNKVYRGQLERNELLTLTKAIISGCRGHRRLLSEVNSGVVAPGVKFRYEGIGLRSGVSRLGGGRFERYAKRKPDFARSVGLWPPGVSALPAECDFVAGVSTLATECAVGAESSARAGRPVSDEHDFCYALPVINSIFSLLSRKRAITRTKPRKEKITTRISFYINSPGRFKKQNFPFSRICDISARPCLLPSLAE